ATSEDDLNNANDILQLLTQHLNDGYPNARRVHHKVGTLHRRMLLQLLSDVVCQIGIGRPKRYRDDPADHESGCPDSLNRSLDALNQDNGRAVSQLSQIEPQKLACFFMFQFPPRPIET